MGLQRNIRGQHIKFYSQVIHKIKKLNKIEHVVAVSALLIPKIGRNLRS